MRRGDESAFSELFARHQGPIYRYAMHMVGRAAADDVVQETFLALIRQPGGFDPGKGAVGAYLFGIARHYVLKRLGQMYADVDATTMLMGGANSALTGVAEPSPLADVQRAESIALVRDAVRSLPLVYREVVALCELQEMDYADAAAMLECPIGTVRSRLHRARALLAQKLADIRESVSVERK